MVIIEDDTKKYRGERGADGWNKRAYEVKEEHVEMQNFLFMPPKWYPFECGTISSDGEGVINW